MDTSKSKRDESEGSSPSKVENPLPPPPPKSSVGSYFRMKTEKPTEPPTAARAFAQNEVTDTSVGNPHYTAELTDEGKLGLFLTRDKARRDPILVSINPDNFWKGINDTLNGALKRLLRNKTGLNDAEITSRIDDVSNILADGCCLIAFMKLRALVTIDLFSRYTSISLKRPRAAKDLPIPTPFAFAIQQLGIVNAADLHEEARYFPVYPDTGHRFGIPIIRNWQDNAYATAVEYARSLGMQFSIVDLTKKQGTAWWLLRQHYAEESFELQCPLPEVNFTDSMAITHTLFLTGEAADPSNPIFTLPADMDNYGYILRDPHTGINISTFEAIENKAPEVVAMV